MKVNLFGIFWHSDNNSNAETGGGKKTTQNVVSFVFILTAEWEYQVQTDWKHHFIVYMYSSLVTEPDLHIGGKAVRGA